MRIQRIVHPSRRPRSPASRPASLVAKLGLFVSFVGLLVAPAAALSTGDAGDAGNAVPGTAVESAAEPTPATPDRPDETGREERVLVVDVPDVAAFRDRYDDLSVGLFSRHAIEQAADALFEDVDAALATFQREVYLAALADHPDIVELHATLVELYGLRNELLSEISWRKSREILGSDPSGLAAARHELAYVETIFVVQLRVIGEGVRYAISNVTESPLGTAWLVVQAIVLVFLFRRARSWSTTGIKRSRLRLLAIRPRQASNLHLARLLWYLDRIAGPLSWLLLVVGFSYLVEPRGFEEIASLVFTVLVWVIVGRLLVGLIDAMAARGIGGLRAERATLRLRSLQLIGGALVAVGLGLDLVDRYAGQGALYGWAVTAAEAGIVGVVLLLIHWWRDEIARRLELRADESAWARRLSSGRGSLVRWAMTIAGASYLMWTAVMRWVLRRVAGWEQGRRLLALLVRREVEREIFGERPDDEAPLDEELATRLLALRDLYLDPVTKSALDDLAGAIEFQRGGGYVVLSERGGGKTSFLARLAERLGERTLVVDCPATGYEALTGALFEQLGKTAEGDDRDAALAAALEASACDVICVDNAHRLTRPVMGGQVGMDRLASLDGRLARSVTWVLAIDRRAWRFIALARAERALIQRVVELPSWSEDELADLVQARCRAAEIDPDYRRIALPAQLDSGEYETLNERNRYGHARMLWELSDGNPAVALRLFVSSLRSLPDGGVVARLPQPVFSTPLNEANAELLLTLRVILQSEIASLDEISRSLRVAPVRTLAAVRYGMQNGWIEEVDGGYRIAWLWYRTISRTLIRSNLMAR